MVWSCIELVLCLFLVMSLELLWLPEILVNHTLSLPYHDHIHEEGYSRALTNVGEAVDDFEEKLEGLVH